MCPLRDGMSFRGLSSARRDELQGTLFCVTEGVSGGGEITYFFVGGNMGSIR